MRTQKTSAVFAVTFTLLLSWTTPAAAQPSASTLEHMGPWTQGVPTERQQKAEAFFKEGNARFEEYAYAAAAKQYRQALKHWDHPAIHYNLALALTTLDKPLEMREHLAAAISHGVDPLDPVRFENAKNSLAFIERSLARVNISCDEPGASVTMDGTVLFIAPGRFEGFVSPGPHTLLATKEGYLDTNLRPALSPGEQSAIHVKLLADQIYYRRKWSAWKPWAVVGTGVALVAGGGGFYLKARADYRAFDRSIKDCAGCVPDTELVLTRDRGKTLHKWAIGTWAAGGAALLTGTALVFLNQPEPYRPRQEGSEQQVVIAPLLGGGARGVMTTFQF